MNGKKGNFMKSNNFKIKQIFTIFLTFSMLFILSGIVKADSNYYIGEKSNHSRKENYLYGITEEMCNADYWKDKNFIDINYLLMNYDQSKYSYCRWKWYNGF